MLEIYKLQDINNGRVLIWIAESAGQAIKESMEQHSYEYENEWSGYEKNITAEKIGVPFANVPAGEV